MFLPVVLLTILLVLTPWDADAFISSMNYVPLGTNPTLYEPGYDPIMQLDSATFQDTVLKQDHAFVVEFYADWCGHCRAFAPYYLEFALSVRPWKSVVTVASINCADIVNHKICSEEGIVGYPMILYYPRYARHRTDAIKLEPKHSLSQMKNQLTQAIRNEYNQYHYADWPDFTHLTIASAMTMKYLWNHANDSHKYLVLLFEQFDIVGVQFLLDMFPARRTVLTRRAIVSSPTSRPLTITHLPYILVFQRGQDEPIYQSPYGSNSLQDVMTITSTTQQPPDYQVPRTALPKQQSIIQCDKYQDRCRELYYVSETDMLKAMRMALFDEVIKTNDNIAGANFTALLNFVSLLADYFPIYTTRSSSSSTAATTAAQISNQKSFTTLRQSARAKMIFSHLRHFLEAHSEAHTVSASIWRNQFENIERVYGYPFPTNASWQHCKGTAPGYRGYTCGLWTTFHAVTVYRYVQGQQQSLLGPLLSIKGWVANFFGCLDCRRHFLHMTTTLYPMNERRIRHAHDPVLYLWRAHNIVNARLHGDTATEDPQFEKRQFPAVFLCPACHSNGMFSRRQIRDFLVSYYTAIRPYNDVNNKLLDV